MIELECYHGTTYEYAESILREGFKPSIQNEKLRLGDGAYFFGRGGKLDYAIECARELERFHFKKGKHHGEYAILSCRVKCDEERYFDMYDPEKMELFHMTRFALFQRRKKEDPNFKYSRAEVADTETMNVLRGITGIAVIRCPQFFGMFEREQEFEFSSGPRFPKTMVPNILLVCADCNKATIDSIELVEKGSFYDEYANIV